MRPMSPTSRSGEPTGGATGPDDTAAGGETSRGRFRSRARTGNGLPRQARRRRLALGLAVLLVLAGAAWLDVAAGRRGFFAFDQSILFDAGFRILSGQTPFAAFRLPFGPVAPALQAGLFTLFGVDFAGYLASAALANAVAAGLAMALLARLLPRHRTRTGRPGWWLLGGALTGIWFYPPSGTPWFEQTALLFVLAGVVLLLPAVLAERPRPRHLLAAAGAGACAVLALLTKQNAGGAALPAFALLLVVPWLDGRLGDRRRAVRGERRAGRRPWAPGAAWLTGAMVTAGTFVLWLVRAADPALFVRFALEIPAAEGARRLAAGPGRLLTGSSLGYGPIAVRLAITLATLASVGAVAVTFCRGCRQGHRDGPSDLSTPTRRRLLAGGATAAGLYLTQHLLTATSFNQPAVSMGLAGLLLPLGAGVLLDAIDGIGGMRTHGTGGRPNRHSTGVLRPAILALTAVAALLVAGRGLQIAFSRSVQDVFPPGTRFDRPVAAAGLHGLLWGRPTLVEPPRPETDGPGQAPRTLVTADELETLLTTLRARPGGLFVFPDWTILYGLTDRPAPGPLVWFHQGLTYTARDAPTLDWQLVSDLERQDVQTIVLERASWQGTDRRLADFPRLREHLATCYRPVETIGIFEVFGRVEGSSAATGTAANPAIDAPSGSLLSQDRRRIDPGGAARRQVGGQRGCRQDQEERGGETG